MFGLELARPPAATKPMEGRLAHQETELVALLKKIPLGKQKQERLTKEGKLGVKNLKFHRLKNFNFFH